MCDVEVGWNPWFCGEGVIGDDDLSAEFFGGDDAGRVLGKDGVVNDGEGFVNFAGLVGGDGDSADVVNVEVLEGDEFRAFGSANGDGFVSGAALRDLQASQSRVGAFGEDDFVTGLE